MHRRCVTPAKAGARLQKRSWLPALAGMTILACLATPAAAQDKQPPYWASIASGEAMTRTGPGKNYPGVWLYQRRDLPIRVVRKYEHWRMIEDPDGARGWMLVSLLSDRRTAVVKQGEPRPIHVKADERSPTRYRAEAGVVGRIEHCGNGWCHIAVGKREGYIRTSDIWGVGEGEVVD
jgi:SH3-like domain-containing protein